MNTTTEDKTGNLSKKTNGFYLKKSHAIILAVVISLIFVGSILATYFGKPQTVYKQYTTGV